MNHSSKREAVAHWINLHHSAITKFFCHRPKVNITGSFLTHSSWREAEAYWRRQRHLIRRPSNAQKASTRFGRQIRRRANLERIAAYFGRCLVTNLQTFSQEQCVTATPGSESMRDSDSNIGPPVITTWPYERIASTIPDIFRSLPIPSSSSGFSRRRFLILILRIS